MTKKQESPVDALRDFLNSQEVELEQWNEQIRRMLERMARSRQNDR